ncbi:hypothetical protein PR048_001648 [Dryococelus australis]|uniref:HTH psq-type domain-containing protein n=1 Tax=Dryococelus australis TaxID=614101 RepID=A0ABQ9IJB7_9NEOP|nr:hypothetical protein PR048_001648 [Dryococelus australis]
MWRAQWTSEQMNAAISALYSGRFVKGLASEFGIPRRTLCNHVVSGRTERKSGQSPVLTIEQEIDLSRRLFRLANVGMPITGNVLKRSVYSFYKENIIINPFNPLKRKAGRR